jgi:hypothetical protein
MFTSGRKHEILLLGVFEYAESISNWTHAAKPRGLTQNTKKSKIAALRIADFDFFVLSRTSNFSAIWRLSPLPVTGLKTWTYA